MRRSLHWGMAMRGVRADRAVRPAIREERPRTAAGLRTSPAAVMGAWRGLSGRRYVVTHHPLDAVAAERADGHVAILVRRDADGLAHVVAVAPDGRRPVSWWARARDAGANELHVHRLAESRGERAAMMMDLTA